MNETLLVVSIAAGVSAAAAVLLYRIFREEPARAPERRRPRPQAQVRAQAAPAQLTPDPVRIVHAVALGLEDARERTGAPQIAPGHEEVVARASVLLECVATQPKYAPRKPLLIPELMRAVNDSDTTRRELAAIIARDPALAGELLRLANSPMYRISKQPVEAIERAVVVLGTEGIRSLIAVAILQPVFRVPPGRFARFPEVLWDHAARAAVASETYAAIIDSSDPFAAQLLGLLLGLGRIITFRVMTDAYDEFPALVPDAETFAAVIESSAAGLAAQIAASWGLSARITAALTDDGPDTTGRDGALGRALRFGQAIGALAVLYREELVDEDTAKALMRARRCTDHHFERIWLRLTRKEQ